jgi:tetratricopeptide (TPR) repeat protein
MLENIIQSHQQGRLDEAESGYRSHLQANPDDHRAQYLLAMLLKQRGQREEPFELVKRAVSLAPDQAAYLLALGGMQMEAGQIAAARVSLNATIKLNPNAAQAYVLLARLARRDGDAAEAARQINLALRCDPELAEALLIAGNLALERGEAEEAVRIFSALAQKRPQDAAVQACLGQAFLARGTLAFAEQSLRNALQLAPDFVSARVALGDVLLRQGQVDAAREALTTAVEEDPGSAVGRMLLGDACRAAGDPAAALAAYAPLAEQFAADPPFATAYADALLRSGQAVEARTLLDGVLAVRPDHAPAWRARLEVERFGGDPASIEALIARWKEAIADDPGPLEALALLRETSAPEEAERLAEQAAAADPGAIAAHLVKARAQLARNEAQAAADTLEQALQHAGDARARFSLHRALGAARHGLGDAARAVEHWQSAQRLSGLAAGLPTLSDARQFPAHAAVAEAIPDDALRPLFLVAPPGAGGELAAALLQDLGLRVLSDRFFAPPQREDAFGESDLAVWHPDPDADRLEQFRSRYRAGLEKVAVDSSRPFVDWLPAFDAACLPLLQRALPGARLLVVVRDRRDALLHWLAEGAPQRAVLEDIDAAALWLSAAFDHVEHAAESPLALTLAVDALDSAQALPAELLALAGVDAPASLARFEAARNRPGGVPVRLEAGVWERYADVLAGPFVAVQTPAG